MPVSPLVKGAEEGASLTFIGDSRVAQWANHDNFEARYLGFPGATSNQIELFLTRNPTEGEVVVIQLGVNDLRVLGIRPELVDDIVSMVSNSIQRIAILLSLRYESVIILGVFPVAEAEVLRRPVWSKTVGAAVELVNGNLEGMTYPSNAEFVSTSQIFAGLEDRAFRDTLHVTESAYFELNILLQDVLSDALQ